MFDTHSPWCACSLNSRYHGKWDGQATIQFCCNKKSDVDANAALDALSVGALFQGESHVEKCRFPEREDR